MGNGERAEEQVQVTFIPGLGRWAEQASRLGEILGPFQLLATGGVGLKPLTREKWQSGPNMLNKKILNYSKKILFL